MANMTDPGGESKGPGPVPRLSHPIHIIMEFGIVLLFSVKLTTMDYTWERLLFKHRRSNFYVLLIVTHLNQVVDVRIVAHEFQLARLKIVEILARMESAMSASSSP